MCQSNPLCVNRHIILTYHRNGPNPEDKVRQILSIAPILSGQTRQQMNGYLPRQQPQPQQQSPQLSSGGSPVNLIDFDQASTAQKRPSPNSQSLKSGGIPPGLQQPLQPESGEPLKRQDTITKDLDEFVDAELKPRRSERDRKQSFNIPTYSTVKMFRFYISWVARSENQVF